MSRTSLFFFFFNDTATTEIYTLSLHDALPIFGELLHALRQPHRVADRGVVHGQVLAMDYTAIGDRKSTRLNSSHANISYAVFCLKKKKQKNTVTSKRTTT